MGRLVKTVLGKASGKVGDLVFRIVDGKVFIASHIGTNKISKSPECVNNRKRFSAVLKFASAVNKIPDLNIIWSKSRKTAKSGYNKIRSDLVSETWVNGWYGIEIMVDGCIFEINGFEVGE